MGKTKTNNKGVTMKTIIEYKTVKVTQKEYDFLLLIVILALIVMRMKY